MQFLVEHSPRRRQWSGVALAAALGAVGWWWGHPPDQPLETAGFPVPAAASDSFTERLVPPADAGSLPAWKRSGSVDAVNPAANPVRPEGMNEEQWRDLQAALKDHPHRDAEIARVTAYMAYSAKLERYRALRQQGADGAAAARDLADALLAQLPERVANGEMSANEALVLQAALLETLVPDAADREAQSVVQRQRIAASIPTTPDRAQHRELDARFEHEQAALLAEWRQRPAAERDAVQLATALQALRESVFDRSSAAPAEGPATPGAAR